MSANLYYGDERIVFVELTDRGTPYQVFTTQPCNKYRHEHMYDIDFSRSEGQYLMSNSGGGPPHMQSGLARWWAAADLDLSAVELYSGKTGRPVKKGLKPGSKLRVPDDYLVPSPLPKKQWFPVADLAEHVQVCDRMIYCIFCDDWYVEPDWANTLCKHVSYCEECGMWSEPQERCRHDERKEYVAKEA